MSYLVRFVHVGRECEDSRGATRACTYLRADLAELQLQEIMALVSQLVMVTSHAGSVARQENAELQPKASVSGGFQPLATRDQAATYSYAEPVTSLQSGCCAPARLTRTRPAPMLTVTGFMFKTFSYDGFK